MLSKVADMLKLRVQTGNAVVIAEESTLEVLSTDGRRAKLRIRSSNFCSVIFYSSAAQHQQTISFDGDEQIVSLPEGSSVHMNECTVLLKSVGANALVCEFNAPRSVNIEKRK